MLNQRDPNLMRKGDLEELQTEVILQFESNNSGKKEYIRQERFTNYSFEY